jgi:threonine dehydrogenase-like Zn-dependent dehydrogenase
MMTGQESLALEPEATYPFVPGHELTGQVELMEGGRFGRPDLADGARVGVWPALGCEARGLESCPMCVSGWTGLCSRRQEGWPSAGAVTGFNRETGGGWSESCLVHESQLWPLADSVLDDDAVLLDPAAAALGGLLRTNEPRPERTLIIGGGTVGLLAADLDRVLDLSDASELMVRHESQRAWAAGRDIRTTVVSTEQQFRDWAADRGLPATHVTGYGFVYQGIFDRVIVAAGSSSAIQWGLRAVRPRGTLVLVAAPSSFSGLDPTPIWYREITIRGIYEYGPVPWQGETVHPYAVIMPLLEEGRISFRDLITHRFGLEDFADAFDRAIHRRRSGAIKVVFEPTRGSEDAGGAGH